MSYKQGDLIKNDVNPPPALVPGAGPVPFPPGISDSPPVLPHLIPGTVDKYFAADYPTAIDAAGNQHNEFLYLLRELYTDLHVDAANTANQADFGYGKTLSAAYINADTYNLVETGHWNRLFGLFATLSTHQGTPIGSIPASVNIGDIIDAVEQPITGLEAIITNLVNNRLTISTTEAIVTDKLSVSNNTLNTGNSIHTAWVTFPNWNSARYFFNTGGAIRFSALGGGGVWATGLSDMGVISFRAIDTVIGGPSTVNNNKGFYNLTTNNLEIANIAISGSAGSYYKIDAKLNVAPGTIGPTIVITFTITFHNEQAPVSGSFISRVAELRSGGAIPYLDTVFYTQDQINEDLNLFATPSPIYGERTGTGSVTTNTTTLSLVGDNIVAPVTYSWSTLSGEVGITINTSSGNTVASVSNPSVTAGTTESGTIRCVATDSSVPNKTTFVDVPWSTRAYTPLTLSISPSDINMVRNFSGPLTTGAISAIVGGGSGGYTYAWSTTGAAYVKGSATGPTAIIEAVVIAPGVQTGLVTCTVNDTLGAVANASINYRFEAVFPYATLVAGAPYQQSGNATCSVPIGQTTCTTSAIISSAVTGGSGSFSYNWTITDPGGYFSVSPNGSPTIAVSTNRAPGTYYVDASYVVTDLITGLSALSPITRINMTHYPAPPLLTVGIANIAPQRLQTGTVPVSFGWTITGSVSGGTPPYSYSWIKTTDLGGGAAWNISNVNSISTSASFSTSTPGSYGHYFRLTVTDSGAQSSYADFDLAATANAGCTVHTVNFTSNGSYTVQSTDGNVVLIDACGGGGGGGAGTWGGPLNQLAYVVYAGGGSAGGGGGAGWVKDYPLAVNPGDVISVTIGNGGGGGTNPPSFYNDGFFQQVRTHSGTAGGDTIIRVNGATRLVLAGGGGGAGYWAVGYPTFPI